MADLNSPRRFTTREWLEHRLTGMMAMRKPLEEDWREIDRLAKPSRSEFLYQTGGYGSATYGNSNASGQWGRRRANTSKQDTAGRIAGRTLVNGMATGMSSNARPWFKLGPPDMELGEYEPVKEWLHFVERALYSFFNRTNYYDANKVAYSELGHCGVACNFGIEHPEYMAVWHPLEVGEYWIAQDAGLRVDAVCRKVFKTVDNMVATFPWNKLTRIVQDAYNKGNLHMLVPCYHFVYANRERDARYFDGPNKPWRSVWWEEGRNEKDDEWLLQVSGYDTKPFSAPRWETRGTQVYSDSAPAFDALPDLRELELAARRYGRAMDNLVKPALNVPAGLQQTPISVDPGSINFINEMQVGARVEPTIRPDPNTLPAIERGREWITNRVNTVFYADLWMAITSMEGIQPRNQDELEYRNEEKLTQLGPVVDRVNIEKLEVDIDRAFVILQNLGRIPPAPPELQGNPLEVEFVSILAQAQKAAANSQIERAARFVGFIAGQFPDAALKFDAQQAIDEWAANAGTNPRIIRSDDVVARMVEQMEQQKQAEQMAQMAPAVAQGAQGAELLSRTQVGPQGTSMLDQLMGV